MQKKNIRVDRVGRFIKANIFFLVFFFWYEQEKQSDFNNACFRNYKEKSVKYIKAL